MKATVKVIKSFPKEVQRVVNGYKSRYRTRNVDFEQVEVGWQLYIDEGASYFVWHDQTEKSVSFTAQSERTFHAGGKPIEYAVGQKCPPFPVGTWVVEFELFMGKPFVNVFHVVRETIAERV